MLLSLLYFLPFLTCLIWLLLFNMRKRTTTQTGLMRVTLFAAFYFLVFAFYIYPEADYVWMCRLDLCNQFVILFSLAALFAYVHTYWKGKPLPKHKRLMLDLPALVHGSVMIVLYFMVGTERLAYLYKAVDTNLGGAGDSMNYTAIKPLLNNDVEFLYWLFGMFVINVLGLAFIVAILILGAKTLHRLDYRFGDLYRFLFKGMKFTPAKMVIVFVMLLCIALSQIALSGRSFLFNTPWLGISFCLVTTLLLFGLEFVEYCNNLHSFALNDLFHVDFDLQGKAEKESEVVVDDEDESVAEEANVEVPTDEERKEVDNNYALTAKLDKAINEGKIYKDSSLSRDSLALTLGTNRTTLSSMLNRMYGMSFNAYIGKIRVEAAKTYMRRCPSATLEEVAQECGFKDAASFCHKFKEVTGYSPKGWLNSAEA